MPIEVDNGAFLCVRCLEFHFADLEAMVRRLEAERDRLQRDHTAAAIQVGMRIFMMDRCRLIAKHVMSIARVPNSNSLNIVLSYLYLQGYSFLLLCCIIYRFCLAPAFLTT